MSFDWLAGVPLAWGVGITVALYLAVLIWAVTRPRRLIYSGAPDGARWRDLRLWVVPLVLTQVVLYLVFR
jgi:hypothetical protein